MTINLIFNNIYSSLNIDLSDYLIAEGILITDISDANIEIREQTDISILLIQKLLSQSQLVRDDPTNSLLVPFVAGDYSTLAIGKTYYLGLAVEFTKNSVINKPEITLEDNVLQVTQNYIDPW